jgi:hypothetical protein
MEEYLKPTEFFDFDEPEVHEYASRNSDEKKTATENAVSLYYAVRDGFKYNPYTLDLLRDGLRASNLVKRKSGYCHRESDSSGGERESRRHSEPSEFLQRQKPHCDRENRENSRHKRFWFFTARRNCLLERSMAENDAGF